MLPACGADATPLMIDPMPGPSRPGVVRMSFWMMCENGTVLFETRKPWQLAFGFAEPPPPAGGVGSGIAAATLAPAPLAASVRAVTSTVVRVLTLFLLFYLPAVSCDRS